MYIADGRAVGERPVNLGEKSVTRMCPQIPGALVRGIRKLTH